MYASLAAPAARTVAAGPVLALDLGATRVRAAAVSVDGRVLARGERRTPGADGPAAVVDAAIRLLQRVATDLDADQRSALVGIGIGAPGPVDPRAGTLVDPPNIGPGFRDVPLTFPIGAALGLPAFLERDTNVAALGEHAYGAARGARDFLYVTVSTGIGGAIVAGGELYGGADGLAGELGHLPVGLDEPPCACGGAGHLEATSSGSGIARQARALAAAGTAPGIAARQERLSPRRLEGRDVAELEAAGDPDAAAIMAHARRAFAAAMVALVDIFNPELIVVGGGIADAEGDRLLGPARDAVARVAFRIQRERVRIVPSVLGEDVGLAGAQPLVALRGV